MRRVLISILLASTVCLAGAVCFLLANAPPSTAELDQDLTTVRAEISAAAKADAAIEGGLIKAMIALRLETLRQTEAMLSQKRASLLRGISLVYQIDGAEKIPANNAELHQILEDLDEAKKKGRRRAKEGCSIFRRPDSGHDDDGGRDRRF